MSRRRSRRDGAPRTITISTRTWTIAFWAVLALIGFHLFRASAHAWGDSIIDLGRDLTIPSELLAGRVLYRDLLYNYGPVVPYLLAGVVWLFGDGLNVFAGYGVAVGLATVAALWTIGRQVGRRDAVIPWAAFFSALLFVVCCFFANTSWGCNFVLPYSFAATTATAFSLWSFSFLLQHLERRDRRSFYLSGAFLILTVFTKHEVGAGIAAVHVVAWILHGVDRRALIGVIGAGLVVGGTLAFAFAARGPADHTLLAENILKPVTGVEMFHAAVGGFADPVTNGLHMVVAVMQLALIAALGGIGGLFVAWRRQAADGKAALAALSLGFPDRPRGGHHPVPRLRPDGPCLRASVDGRDARGHESELLHGLPESHGVFVLHSPRDSHP